MIIDAHTHIGFGKLINRSPKELVNSMQKSGIDYSIVFAGEINACSTERLVESLRPYKGKLFPVGSVSPLSKQKPKLAHLEKWLRSGEIFGLKFYPGYERFAPTSKIISPYLELLQRFHRPAIFHTGDTYNIAQGALLKFTAPLLIDEVAVRYPNLPIIIGHMGNPWLMDAMEVAFKNANVFADCAGWVYGKFKPIERIHYRKRLEDMRGYLGNFEKVIFGTDWPISDQKSYVNFIRSARFSQNEKRKIFAENAINVFNLPIKL